ncbi:MAG: 5-methyltetrahydropteroyltriglutamate--homocysteine S-methyltransferase, partial [Campylobacteraceae bacterium]|nr:5-methyltetrahydropteroyltriglutamate--homocysteine S-methyltransferase [Campylobacteraceae bacterium]
MPKNSIVGFPRIGEQRELKFALEAFWAGKSTKEELLKVAGELRLRHLNHQSGIDLVSVNDFSLYDNMLDMIVILGVIPQRFADIKDELALYFAMARGDKNHRALEMTKWFNTNYHYIVPELSRDTKFALNASKIVSEYKEAKALNVTPKINIIGPLTFLSLSKSVDETKPYDFFEKVLNVYEELLRAIALVDAEAFVQFDEPIAVTDLTQEQKGLLKSTYERLSKVSPKLKLIVQTYFDYVDKDSVEILAGTDIWGIGLDFVHGKENADNLKSLNGKYLLAGVVDGRNIWISDIKSTVTSLEKIAQAVGKERVIVSTSCSLLHTPYSLCREDKIDSDIKEWLSFALEKLDEISLITKLFSGEALNSGDKAKIEANEKANISRKNSPKIHNSALWEKLKTFTNTKRGLPFEERIKIQKEVLNYQPLATTTIGSFPQASELRNLRSAFKKGEISPQAYEDSIKNYIKECVKIQEEIGLDILVHGEFERNDMVEYFGEQLEGYAFTQNGWVQSYGSRCVKPPLLFGDVTRAKPMTLKWITYAQSLTKKVVKGMLTGPVTILNWSFVRDDIPRQETAKQLAFVLHNEIEDLQNADIKIIQVDEAAFKEGYPLRESKKQSYEKWAVESFKLA